MSQRRELKSKATLPNELTSIERAPVFMSLPLRLRIVPARFHWGIIMLFYVSACSSPIHGNSINENHSTEYDFLSISVKHYYCGRSHSATPLLTSLTAHPFGTYVPSKMLLNHSTALGALFVSSVIWSPIAFRSNRILV